MSRQFGDFQTPEALVAEVFGVLTRRGVRWTRVLEPTCGRGHFIRGALAALPELAEVVGIELQPGHLRAAEAALSGGDRPEVRLRLDSVFARDLCADLAWTSPGPLLVVGNPPWVTNAELGALASDNLPAKHNLKGLRGIEALTGSANFDLAEAVLLKLVGELAPLQPTIAMLVKTAVARNLIEHAQAVGLPVVQAEIRRIDAKRWFKVGVEASLFILELGPSEGRDLAVPVYDRLDAAEPATVLGMAGGRLVADLQTYRSLAFADGECPMEWRQGLKHDAAAVMELTRAEDGALVNGLGEPVEVESAYVFPLWKGAKIHGGPRAGAPRWVIVPQRALREDLAHLETDAPRLWAYLMRHRAAFEARKSAIYRNQPPFSLFGVGPYTFAPYKVAISALHKTPRFRALGPEGGQPAIVGDTSYFLPCDSATQAALATTILNHPSCTALLGALSFTDAMRPITKKLLRRIDLIALLERLSDDECLRGVNQVLAELGMPAVDGPPGAWRELLSPDGDPLSPHGR